MTRWEPNGLSSTLRWYELCTRLACFWQFGHCQSPRTVETIYAASPSARVAHALGGTDMTTGPCGDGADRAATALKWNAWPLLAVGLTLIATTAGRRHGTSRLGVGPCVQSPVAGPVPPSFAVSKRIGRSRCRLRPP